MRALKERGNYFNSLKSVDTEGPLDLVFYRPIGYCWALLAQRAGISPNQITVFSIIIGISAGICFYFNSLWINVIGVLLLVWANTYDSADGQLARMTGQKTKLGRILDGVGGFIWFIAIYIAIVLRSWPDWGFWGLAIAAVSGYFHGTQTAIADYCRNAYLFFKNGKAGSEADNSREVAAKYRSLSWSKQPVIKLFECFYLKYTRNQERLTPKYQQLMRQVRRNFRNGVPTEFAEDFCYEMHPLLIFTNLLTFNFRSIVLFICVLSGFPMIYFFFELTVMNGLLLYLLVCHESFSKKLEKTYFFFSS
ncbi:MAG: CDP-alcohol phosphatidyltransferase family protein [Dysgonamonadaceae bacterium]|jgi:hypothetical protein|nr:CDP-alcohol phosphatidyltransferase family protein [Dysgonamonadaceae bacterium]